MSLPAGQQRVLDGIAETLRLTEPRLTTMFAIFTRLTKNEPRPWREQVAPPGRLDWLMAGWRRLLRSHGKRGSLKWRRLAIISQLAIAFAMFAVLIGFGSHGAASCGGPQRPSADAISVPRQPTCSPSGQPGAGLIGK